MPFMNHVLTRAPAQFASQLVSRLASQLGRCPRCMRSCLAVAVTMWMVWLVASITVSRPEIAFGIAILAFALTGLWMAHLSAFGFRIALTQMGDQPRAGAACQATSPRREFVASLAKSMALAVVTTALLPSSLAKSASAFPANNARTAATARSQNAWRPAKILTPRSGGRGPGTAKEGADLFILLVSLRKFH